MDAESQNITAESVRAVLTPRSRAVICVHLAGWPCELDPIMELAEEKGLYVIEDCAQAHGARYRGRPVGGWAMWRPECYLFVRPQRLAPGWDRDRIMAAINDQGVPCYSGSCSEIYQEKAFADANLRPSNPLPIAHDLGQTSLMFLVHPTLTTED